MITNVDNCQWWWMMVKICLIYVRPQLLKLLYNCYPVVIPSICFWQKNIDHLSITQWWSLTIRLQWLHHKTLRRCQRHPSNGHNPHEGLVGRLNAGDDSNSWPKPSLMTLQWKCRMANLMVGQWLKLKFSGHWTGQFFWIMVCLWLQNGHLLTIYWLIVMSD